MAIKDFSSSWASGGASEDPNTQDIFAAETAPEPNQERPSFDYSEQSWSDIKSNPEFMRDLRRHYAVTGSDRSSASDEELLNEFVSDGAWAEINSMAGGLGTFGVRNAYTLGDEDAKRMSRLLKAHEKHPLFFQEGGRGLAGLMDNVFAAVVDPVNLIPIPGVGQAATKGAFAAARQAVQAGGTQLTKSAMREVAKEAVKQGIRKGVIQEAAANGAIEATYDAMLQARDIELGLQEDFDYGRFGLATALGAGLGAGVGYGVAKVTGGALMDSATDAAMRGGLEGERARQATALKNDVLGAVAKAEADEVTATEAAARAERDSEKALLTDFMDITKELEFVLPREQWDDLFELQSQFERIAEGKVDDLTVAADGRVGELDMRQRKTLADVNRIRWQLKNASDPRKAIIKHLESRGIKILEAEGAKPPREGLEPVTSGNGQYVIGWRDPETGEAFPNDYSFSDVEAEKAGTEATGTDGAAGGSREGGQGDGDSMVGESASPGPDATGQATEQVAEGAARASGRATEEAAAREVEASAGADGQVAVDPDMPEEPDVVELPTAEELKAQMTPGEIADLEAMSVAFESARTPKNFGEVISGIVGLDPDTINDIAGDTFTGIGGRGAQAARRTAAVDLVQEIETLQDLLFDQFPVDGDEIEIDVQTMEDLAEALFPNNPERAKRAMRALIEDAIGDEDVISGMPKRDDDELRAAMQPFVERRMQRERTGFRDATRGMDDDQLLNMIEENEHRRAVRSAVRNQEAPPEPDEFTLGKRRNRIANRANRAIEIFAETGDADAAFHAAAPSYEKELSDLQAEYNSKGTINGIRVRSGDEDKVSELIQSTAMGRISRVDRMALTMLRYKAAGSRQTRLADNIRNMFDMTEDAAPVVTRQEIRDQIDSLSAQIKSATDESLKKKLALQKEDLEDQLKGIWAKGWAKGGVRVQKFLSNAPTDADGNPVQRAVRVKISRRAAKGSANQLRAAWIVNRYGKQSGWELGPNGRYRFTGRGNAGGRFADTGQRFEYERMEKAGEATFADPEFETSWETARAMFQSPEDTSRHMLDMSDLLSEKGPLKSALRTLEEKGSKTLSEENEQKLLTRITEGMLALYDVHTLSLEDFRAIEKLDPKTPLRAGQDVYVPKAGLKYEEFEAGVAAIKGYQDLLVKSKARRALKQRVTELEGRLDYLKQHRAGTSIKVRKYADGEQDKLVAASLVRGSRRGRDLTDIKATLKQLIQDRTSGLITPEEFRDYVKQLGSHEKTAEYKQRSADARAAKAESARTEVEAETPGAEIRIAVPEGLKGEDVLSLPLPDDVVGMLAVLGRPLIGRVPKTVGDAWLVADHLEVKAPKNIAELEAGASALSMLYRSLPERPKETTTLQKSADSLKKLMADRGGAEFAFMRQVLRKMNGEAAPIFIKGEPKKGFIGEYRAPSAKKGGANSIVLDMNEGSYDTFLHELGHWAYQNVLTNEQRSDFWRMVGERYYSESEFNVQRALNEAGLPTGYKAYKDWQTPQEMFAHFFTRYGLEMTTGEERKLFSPMADEGFVSKMMSSFQDVLVRVVQIMGRIINLPGSNHTPMPENIRALMEYILPPERAFSAVGDLSPKADAVARSNPEMAQRLRQIDALQARHWGISDALDNVLASASISGDDLANLDSTLIDLLYEAYAPQGQNIRDANTAIMDDMRRRLAIEEAGIGKVEPISGEEFYSLVNSLEDRLNSISGQYKKALKDWVRDVEGADVEVKAPVRQTAREAIDAKKTPVAKEVAAEVKKQARGRKRAAAKAKVESNNGATVTTGTQAKKTENQLPFKGGKDKRTPEERMSWALKVAPKFIAKGNLAALKKRRDEIIVRLDQIAAEKNYKPGTGDKSGYSNDQITNYLSNIDESVRRISKKTKKAVPETTLLTREAWATELQIRKLENRIGTEDPDVTSGMFRYDPRHYDSTVARMDNQAVQAAIDSLMHTSPKKQVATRRVLARTFEAFRGKIGDDVLTQADAIASLDKNVPAVEGVPSVYKLVRRAGSDIASGDHNRFVHGVARIAQRSDALTHPQRSAITRIFKELVESGDTHARAINSDYSKAPLAQRAEAWMGDLIADEIGPLEKMRSQFDPTTHSTELNGIVTTLKRATARLYDDFTLETTGLTPIEALSESAWAPPKKVEYVGYQTHLGGLPDELAAEMVTRQISLFSPERTRRIEAWKAPSSGIVYRSIGSKSNRFHSSPMTASSETLMTAQELDDFGNMAWSERQRLVTRIKALMQAELDDSMSGEASALAARKLMEKHVDLVRASEARTGEPDPEIVVPYFHAARQVFNATTNVVMDAKSLLPIKARIDSIVRQSGGSTPDGADEMFSGLMTGEEAYDTLLDYVDSSMASARTPSLIDQAGVIERAMTAAGYDGVKLNDFMTIFDEGKVRAFDDPIFDDASVSMPMPDEDVVSGMSAILTHAAAVSGTAPKIDKRAATAIRAHLASRFGDPEAAAAMSVAMSPDVKHSPSVIDQAINGLKKLDFTKFFSSATIRMAEDFGAKSLAAKFGATRFGEAGGVGLLDKIPALYYERMSPVYNAMQKIPGRMKPWQRARRFGDPTYRQSDVERAILRAMRYRHAGSGNWESHLSALSTEDHVAAREFIDVATRQLNKERDAMRAAGVDLGDLGDFYVPQLWDIRAIEKNRTKVVNVLAEKFARERGAKTPDVGLKARNDAELVVERMIDNDGFMTPQAAEPRTERAESIQYNRMLHLTPSELDELNDFLIDDLEGTFTRYFDSSARYGALREEFGHNNHWVYDYVEASFAGVKGIEDLLKRNSVKRYTIAGGEEDIGIVEVRKPLTFGLDEETARKVANRALAIARDARDAKRSVKTDVQEYLWAQFPTEASDPSSAMMKRIDAISSAMDDYIDYVQFGGATSNRMQAGNAQYIEQFMRTVFNMRPDPGADNRMKHDIFKAIRGFNNVTMLGAVTLTSLPDTVMPLIRSGNMGAYLKATYNLLASPERHHYREAIRRTGVAIENAVYNRMVNMYGGGPERLTTAFFNLNGLTPWTNMMRTLAGAVAYESFRAEAKILKDPNSGRRARVRARRYLDHFGLAEYADEGMSFDDPAFMENLEVKGAIHRFAQESVFAPNAVERQPWMSTWWGATVMQLKNFPMLMGRLGKYTVHEAWLGNPRPLAMLLGVGVGAASGSLALKDILQSRGGRDNEEPEVRERRLSSLYKEFTGNELRMDESADAALGWMAEGFLHVGGLGLLANILYESAAQADNDYYGMARIMGLIGGPTVSRFQDLIVLSSGLKESVFDAEESNARERAAARIVAGAIPFVGANRGIREDLVDMVAGDPTSRSGGRGGGGFGSF